MIEAFFFDDGRLFGCYHPSVSCDSRKLMVLCPPFFDDYRRTYRALYELAVAGSAKGLHVLRFDYFGTGESWGGLDEASVALWLENIQAAIDEGLALSGADRVLLTGVRFGATLAAQVRHPAIQRYLLWDPLPDGATYLSIVDAYNSELATRHRHHAQNNKLAVEDIDYGNFDLPDSLRSGMQELQPFSSSAATTPFCLITTDRNHAATASIPVEFAGIEYEWPLYHDGIVTLKPVLETILRKALDS